MSPIYEAIGRLVFWAVRMRFQRELRIAAAAGLVAILLGGYLAAKRSVDEG